MTDVLKASPRWRGILISLGILVLVCGGGFFLWRASPGYSVYQIKKALDGHDYELLTRYVDVDQVLDHTLDDLGKSQPDESRDAPIGGFLGKLLRKEVFKVLAGEAREVTKAGLSMVVEQLVRDRDRPPPDIPAIAPLAAWWLAERDGETARLTFETKKDKDKPVVVTMQRVPDGVWRVVAVSNLQVFLPKLKKHLRTLSNDRSHPEENSE